MATEDAHHGTYHRDVDCSGGGTDCNQCSSVGATCGRTAGGNQGNVQLYLINKRTPIWINPQLKITEVSRNGETILFSMGTTLPGDRWTQEMRDRASQETTKGLCSDKDMRVLLGYAFQMRYVVTDPSGRYVPGFSVSKDQCLTTEN